MAVVVVAPRARAQIRRAVERSQRASMSQFFSWHAEMVRECVRDGSVIRAISPLGQAEIYAENRAPEYWIDDLASRSVFMHTDPVRGRYRSVI